MKGGSSDIIEGHLKAVLFKCIVGKVSLYVCTLDHTELLRLMAEECIEY